MSCDPHDGCITCGDTAVEMRVVRVDEERELALCADDSGARSTVEVALVQPVDTGDRLLVHAGTALGRAAVTEEHPYVYPGTPGREAEEVPGLSVAGTPGREAEEVPGLSVAGTPGREAEEVPGK